MDERFLTPSEIAGKLHVHEKTVHRWLNSGKLRGIKLDKFWRIEERDFRNFLDAHKVNAQ